MQNMKKTILVDQEVYAPIAEIVFYTIETKPTSQDHILRGIHYKLLQEHMYGKTAIFNEFELSTLKRVITAWQDLDKDAEGKIYYTIGTDEEYEMHLQYLEANADIALTEINNAIKQLG